jgi:hypothetical protein
MSNKDIEVILNSKESDKECNGNLADETLDGSSFMSVHASLIMDLDFLHGKFFAKEIWTKFHSLVHSSPSPGHFMVVVSFGRANIHLEETCCWNCSGSCIRG